MSFAELFDRHGSDKASVHSYGTIYDLLLHGLHVEAVLELGIGSGASLRAWREAFPAARIFGLDNQVSNLLQEDRITTFAGHQAHPSAYLPFFAAAPFDLIVDDASHRIADQMTSFWHLWPHVRQGGLYCIEDISRPESFAALATVPGATLFDRRAVSGRQDDCLLAIRRL